MQGRAGLAHQAANGRRALEGVALGEHGRDDLLALGGAHLEVLARKVVDDVGPLGGGDLLGQEFIADIGMTG